MIVLERGRARARVIPSTALMGGASLPVPHGATTTAPAAPLDFSGFDTLSVKGHIAGLSGGDTVTLRVNTVDPESSSGAEVAGASMIANLATIAANGDFAATLYLGALYTTAKNQIIVPASDGTPPGLDWSKVGSSGSYASILSAGADTAYARWGLGLGTTALSIRLATVADPGTTSGWSINIRSRSSIPNTNARMEMSLSNNPGATIYDKLLGAPANTNPSGVVATVTGSFATYNLPLTTGQAALADFTKQPWLFNLLFSGVDTGTETWDFPLVQLVVPPAGGLQPAVSGAPPFYLNVFDFVNAGAHDATVTAFEATLTNARNRPWLR